MAEQFYGICLILIGSFFQPKYSIYDVALNNIVIICFTDLVLRVLPSALSSFLVESYEISIITNLF